MGNRAAAERMVIVTREPAPSEEDVRIPAAAHTVSGFRAWVHSGRFPEVGRIDYVGGSVELDMSPEDLQTHGTLKAELAAELVARVVKPRHGYVFIDRTRVTAPGAGLSVEPDLVVVLFSSLDAGRVRQVPSAGNRAGRFIELEGAPDLVVEILSDTSEKKDTQSLPPSYARAGIPELWLLDARGDPLIFEIRILHQGEYRAVEPEPGGWVHSRVLGDRLRVTRRPAPHSGWFYKLQRKRRARS
jgi:Uma2 family endonuclease